MATPIVSLPHLLTRANTRNLEHLSLSHMRVDEHELLDCLAKISQHADNKLKSIKQYNVMLMNRVAM